MLKKTLFLSIALLLGVSKLQSSIMIDDAVKKQLDLFAQSAYSTLPTLYMSYKLSAECIKNNIPGDFVECGVANGSQVAAMAYACQVFNVNTRVHLFDSFEGIPLAGVHDTEQPGIGHIAHDVHIPSEQLLVSSGISAHSLEDVKLNMNRWGISSHRLVYHKGWFQHTLPQVSDTINSISFLRLDGDLYESTKVCLEYLYPKVSKGGYVVIDDFGSLEGCKKAVLEYLAEHNLNPTIIPIEGGQGPVYWIVE